ncbi:MAG: hypothetical protein DYG89_22225 [Caldilinea sp. CFX5]|nr:hypothetical protein [Caldilinea sp. CFX5]
MDFFKKSNFSCAAVVVGTAGTLRGGAFNNNENNVRCANRNNNNPTNANNNVGFRVLSHGF